MPITQLSKKNEISVIVGKGTVTEDIGDLRLPAFEREVNTNGLANSLPTNIPNTRFSETIVDVKNPALHLIVVKQTHGVERSLIRQALVEDFSEKLAKDKIPDQVLNAITTPDFIEKTAGQSKTASDVQKDIIEIVKFLSKEHGINAVYKEGLDIKGGLDKISPENAQSLIETKRTELSKAMADEKLHLQKYEQVKSALATRTDISEEGKKVLLDYEKRFPGQIFKIMDKVDELKSIVETSSGARLQAEGITLIPTEMTGVFDAAKKLDANQSKVLDNAREETVVQLASLLEKAGGDKVAVVIFGRTHDFEDNVRAFNETHEDKIMLSVVTPQSLEDKK